MFCGDASELKLPDNNCSYETYDPVTLEPLNEHTRVRLAELGWRETDFKDKTVLDIGANVGLLSLEALRLGAKSVKAYDVNNAYIEYIKELADKKQLPITAAKRNFLELAPPDDCADVVLFMEVLHWAVSQGTPVEDVIKRLAVLTRETLYIEFPWSVEEPSIKEQTTLTSDEYSADRIIDILTIHFAQVNAVRFMRYFGFNPKIKRVLLKCSKKRLESPILHEMKQVSPLDIQLPFGNNDNRLVYLPEGMFIIKKVDPTSQLIRLSADAQNALFDSLHTKAVEHIVLPKRIGDKYIITYSIGENPSDTISYMVFPVVGNPFKKKTIDDWHLPMDILTDLLLALREELNNVSPIVISSFMDIEQKACWWRCNIDDTFWSMPLLSDKIGLKVKGLYNLIDKEPFKYLDTLKHGDIHSGNIVKTKDGIYKLVDLDNLYIGTTYEDGLLALIYAGAEIEDFKRFAEHSCSQNIRNINLYDVAHAAICWLGWLKIVTIEKALCYEDGIVAQSIQGFLNLLSYSWEDN